MDELLFLVLAACPSFFTFHLDLIQGIRVELELCFSVSELICWILTTSVDLGNLMHELSWNSDFGQLQFPDCFLCRLTFIILSFGAQRYFGRNIFFPEYIMS